MSVKHEEWEARLLYEVLLRLRVRLFCANKLEGKTGEAELAALVDATERFRTEG